MRWIWIDRFVEFESGSQAVAIKNVTLTEDHLHDHFPGFPVMPPSLITEGLAQTGGILLGEHRQFQNPVVLAKIPKMIFHSWACPGDTLTYRAKICDINEHGGMVEVTAAVGSRPVAEGEIMYAHLPPDMGVNQKNVLFFLRLLPVLDVGKAGDGARTDSKAAAP